MVAEENTESVDEEEDRRKRTAWLPWVVLVIAVLIIAWLFWRYAQAPSTSGTDTAGAVLTAATVPHVVGMTADGAVDMIERAGFVAELDSAFSSEAEPGEVASQEPQAGTKRPKGGLVLIVVAVKVGESTGAGSEMDPEGNRVPNVVGLTELRADELLGNSGYGFSPDEGYSTSHRRGIIYSQAPAAGAYAEPGVTVRANVSLGPAPSGQVQVPRVIGLTRKKAVKRLEDAGLDARSMIQWHEGYSGVVFQQDPAAGSLAPTGSRVFILSGE